MVFKVDFSKQISLVEQAIKYLENIKNSGKSLSKRHQKKLIKEIVNSFKS